MMKLKKFFAAMLVMVIVATASFSVCAYAATKKTFISMEDYSKLTEKQIKKMEETGKFKLSDDGLGYFYIEDEIVDEPAVEVTVDVTVTEEPATEAPVAEEVAVTEEPATEAPVAEEVAVTEEPATEAPVAEEVAVTEEPATEAPVAEEVAVTEESATEAPVAEEVAVTEEPATEAPVAEEVVVTEESATEAPVTEEVVVTEESATEAPVTEEVAVTEEPATEAPVAEEVAVTEEPVQITPPEEREIKIKATYKMAGALLTYGDTIKLTAKLIGYENLEYTMNWQYCINGEWFNLEGANTNKLTIVVSEENVNYGWRMYVSVNEPNA